MSKKFIERHGLWTPEQRASAPDVLGLIEWEGLEIIRQSYAEQHGLVRGKSLFVEAIKSAFAADRPVSNRQ
ncbi:MULTISPECIES: hypothetical protein [Pseudomonadaceae]|uniref:Uncharacterized protein n=1 Tax=Stutzerimonas xanthomarina TaxID=271420 RepID=A0A427DK62_9GAMM|nr:MULTISPECIES: hypothetical protein [Pseudomonadaceae]MDB1107864.1 hypothetical protein [Pseudomonas extremaustralis]RRV03592.1 hypothetical protein EGJ28_23625 [Stutzerimonas xanthomarina]RZO10696.1 hypothetical protein EKG40_03775 [Pseudomonas moorei]WQN29922.1 hypothetical protein ULE26_22955 [Stutzerimonas stutzeri]